MRAVLQRVSRAAVVIDGETVGAIERGLLVLLGVAPTDTPAEAQWLAEKTAVSDGPGTAPVDQLPVLLQLSLPPERAEAPVQ